MLRIMPTIHFGGKHFGEARKAVELYTSLVPLSQITTVRHFGEQQLEGNFVPAQIEFRLGGRPYCAIDCRAMKAQANAAFTFVVQCAAAAAFDRLYDALVDPEIPYDMRYDSSSGQWARFTDRFGLRWELSSPE